jgi:myo-inositol-1(or 4)-monophosphatase
LANAEFKELLAIAEAAAARAGAALKAHRADWSSVASEQGREVKVDADTRAEAMIIKELRRLAPMPILSEEAGWVDDADRVLAWAVDPLDGSVNYIRGYPHCAVSVALLQNGKPVLGVVDGFLLGERFTGLVGAGAWLNGVPISVSDVTEPNQGILHTGIPARAATDPAAMNALMARLAAWRKVRMIGCASMALAYVAAGRAEAYRESGSMIWDVAGGCALVEAAGGEARIIGERIDNPLEVAAGNRRVALPD